jgi:GNAT superfamily N-acetyltransferase
VSKSFCSGATNVELCSIASSEHGKGIGKALMNAFCNEAFSTGARNIELTTDEKENNEVRQFYEKAGFNLKGTVKRGDRVLLIYLLRNTKV